MSQATDPITSSKSVAMKMRFIRSSGYPLIIRSVVLDKLILTGFSGILACFQYHLR